MVSAMNLLAFSVIGTAALTGHLQASTGKLLRFLGVSVLLLILLVFGTRAFLAATIDTSYDKDQLIMEMSLINPGVETRVLNSLQDLAPHDSSDVPEHYSVLEKIKHRGVLRAGYVPGRLPFTFKNDHGELVGLDVELLNILAREMGVTLEFVPLAWDEVISQVNEDNVDIIGTVPLSTRMLVDLDLSDPYLQGEIAVVVRDHRRKDFSSHDKIQAHLKLTMAYPRPVTYFQPVVEKAFPGLDITWIPIDNFEEFFEQEGESIDALVAEVEIGTAWTLLHPEYTVVVPETSILKAPLGFAVPKGQHSFAALLGRWLKAKEATGEIQQAYDYWVLGKGIEKTEPRWSIIKDVLGWQQD